ncbi:hypothetical protein AAC387_Pa09g0594 [Persea americana]
MENADGNLPQQFGNVSLPAVSRSYARLTLRGQVRSSKKITRQAKEDKEAITVTIQYTLRDYEGNCNTVHARARAPEAVCGSRACSRSHAFEMRRNGILV